MIHDKMYETNKSVISKYKEIRATPRVTAM